MVADDRSPVKPASTRTFMRVGGADVAALLRMRAVMRSFDSCISCAHFVKLDIEESRWSCSNKYWNLVCTVVIRGFLYELLATLDRRAQSDPTRLGCSERDDRKG